MSKIHQWLEGCRFHSLQIHQPPLWPHKGSKPPTLELNGDFQKKLANLSEKERDEIKNFLAYKDTEWELDSKGELEKVSRMALRGEVKIS